MFHFRLQSVLEVRERLARIKQKEFSEVLALRHAMEKEIEDNRAQLTQSGRYMDKVRETGGIPYPLALFDNFKRKVNADIGRLNEQIREHNQDLEFKRTNLIEAKRAQRSLEILKEKQQARYDQDMTRRERAVMDEIAASFHRYRQK